MRLRWLALLVSLPLAGCGLVYKVDVQQGNLFDKATVDARVDPNADQGRLSTSLSRSVPIGGGMSITVQNGYAVTQSLANPSGALPSAPGTAPTRVYTGDGGVRLELPSAASTTG